jgi:Ala-tRNA(Pro) deacylase
MPISWTIKEYLLRKDVSYSSKSHPLAFTAQEIAAADHIPGREFAKTVVLRAGNRLVMAVLRADRVINMEALKRGIGCDKLALASETEFFRQFPSCEPGAMPPFGKLFGLPLYCDKALAKQAEIEFNAGTHTDTVRMRFSEFVRLEDPPMLDFSEQSKGQGRARAA